MTKQFVFITLFMVVALTFCTEDRMFSSCSFDNKTKQECSTDNELECVNFSCAVPDHPECIDMICLSYQGAQPRCTHECDPAQNDCPSGSQCMKFSVLNQEDSYACVRTGDIESELFKDCSLNPSVCQEFGADVCADFGGDNICTKACNNVCDSDSACQEYNGSFFCLKNCKQNAKVCNDNEVCVEYGNSAYCFEKCPEGGTCATKAGVDFIEPVSNMKCDAHGTCPGRSFCRQYKNLGFFCQPCDYAVSNM